jgi:hypothetical protein
VNLSTTPYVGYTYSEMAGGANHSRLTQIAYRRHGLRCPGCGATTCGDLPTGVAG